MLVARVRTTILREVDPAELGCKPLLAGEMRALTVVRSGRATVWDRAIKKGAQPGCLAARLGCVYGCRHASGEVVLGSFAHYALFCSSPAMQWHRGLVE